MSVTFASLHPFNPFITLDELCCSCLSRMAEKKCSFCGDKPHQKSYIFLIKWYVINTYLSWNTLALSLTHILSHGLVLSFLWSSLPSQCFYLLTQRRNHNKLSLNEPLFCWPSTMTGFYSEFWHGEFVLSAFPQNKGWGQNPNKRALSPPKYLYFLVMTSDCGFTA